MRHDKAHNAHCAPQKPQVRHQGGSSPSRLDRRGSPAMTSATNDTLTLDVRAMRSQPHAGRLDSAHDIFILSLPLL